jgi:hypothetical protein
MTKAPKRPRDLKQWAKRMVDIANGRIERPRARGQSNDSTKGARPYSREPPKEPGTLTLVFSACTYLIILSILSFELNVTILVQA